MDGADLALFVREKYPNLAVILTSGAVARPNAGESVEFVAKPYMPEEIVRRVRDLLGKGDADPDDGSKRPSR
jgi:hypothetical protein